MPATDIVSVGVTASFAGFTGELVDVKFSGGKVDIIDVTDQAAASKWRIFRGGLKDAGTVTLTCLHSGAKPTVGTGGNHGDNETLTIGFPASNGITAAGILQDFSINAPLGDKITCDLTIKLTGPLT